jgi:predicted TPR repeat methyltransferase
MRYRSGWQKVKIFRKKVDLVGVDISKKMINICKSSLNYSNLHESGISEYLENSTDKYDVIVACSVIQFFYTR